MIPGVYSSFLSEIYLFLESYVDATFYEETQLATLTGLAFEYLAVANLVK